MPHKPRQQPVKIVRYNALRHHWTPEEKVEMARLYTVEEWSLQEIANHFYVSRNVVHHHLCRAGVTMRPRGMCTERSRDKYRGEKHGRWKGGRAAGKSGYVMVARRDHPHANPHGHYVFEHRLVVEEHLRSTEPDHPALDEQGYLRKSWVVHHKNRDKADNRIENLEVMLRNKHNPHMHHVEEIERLKKLLDDSGVTY